MSDEEGPHATEDVDAATGCADDRSELGRAIGALTWTPQEMAIAQSVDRLRALIREVIAAKRMPHEWVQRAEDELDE